MNKLIRPSISMWQRNVSVAGLSTNNQLFASTTGSGNNPGTSSSAKQNNTNTLRNIAIAGILGGVAFAYYEYKQADENKKGDEK